jgi:hypothetical protein
MFGLLGLHRPPRWKNRIRLALEGLEDRWTPANFDVANLDDAGNGSLRAAITAANAAAGADTITFAANANGVIGLQTKFDDITGDVEIKGPTAAGSAVTVQRAAAANFRIFTIAQGATVTISKLTIANGATTDDDKNGGGIKVLGKLTLNDGVVQNNDAVGGGGGIWVGSAPAELTLNNTKVLNNRANGDGGGIAIVNGMATISAKSDVSSNQAFGKGGGIRLIGVGQGGVKLKVDDSTITGNTAIGDGGGINAFWAGGNRVELTKTKVDGNRSINGSGGGIHSGANTTMDAQSSVSNNKSGDRKGEGIVVWQRAAVTLNGAKVNGNQYFPPPPPPPSPPPPGGVPNGLVDLPGEDLPVERLPEEDLPIGPPGGGVVDDGLPCAIYVEDGAELILGGCEIIGNDGHGVMGQVTSLGYNYVENSLTSSVGWIETDTVT